MGMYLNTCLSQYLSQILKLLRLLFKQDYHNKQAFN